MHRNQDARPIYVVATLALLAVLVVALFTRWRTTALVLVPLVWLLLLGFMLPLGAEVVPGGVRFRWPLRRVLVTPGELKSVRMVPGPGRTPMVRLRVGRTPRWTVMLHRWTDPDPLAAALLRVVQEADGLQPERREQVLAHLHNVARR
ncbi:hypothetical protein [Angustibacter aerolatus]